MEMSPGVRYCAIVSLRAAFSAVTSGKTSCTLPLPNVCVPDDDGAIVVLQRAGHDLARARAVAAHEDHDRVQCGSVPSPLARFSSRPSEAADGGHDDAVGEELVGDARRGLVEQAARVAAQIEHERAFSCPCCGSVVERRVELQVGKGRLERA